jgi:hypothetical protein
MKVRSGILSILSILLVSSAMIIGCSDDDGGTGPVVTGDSIDLQLRVGDQFWYTKWELDANNQKIGNGTEVKVRYKDNGGASLEGFTDWLLAREEDPQTLDLIQELRIRTDPKGNLYMHNFQYDLYIWFFDLIKQFDPTFSLPGIGEQGWDPIAMFNSEKGVANPAGFEWEISNPNIDPFNFNVELSGTSLQVSMKPVVKGFYDGPGTPVEINGVTSNVWTTRISVVFQVRSLLLNPDIEIVQTVTYSDDPAGQVVLERETATLDVPGVGTYPQPGERRELNRYVKF